MSNKQARDVRAKPGKWHGKEEDEAECDEPVFNRDKFADCVVKRELTSGGEADEYICANEGVDVLCGRSNDATNCGK